MMTAGPVALMATLLSTNSPAPMRPPMVIIATCLGRSERLSSWDSAGAIVTASFVDGQYSGSSESPDTVCLRPMRGRPRAVAAIFLILSGAAQADTPPRPRAPDLGLKVGVLPRGPLDAI